jgi:hypothetical protein
MADVGSFLEGLSEGLAPWAEAQARHKYARDERVAAAAFVKAKNAKIIEGNAELLADRFSGSEEQGESWNAVKSGLIRYANHNPAFLTNIRKDIAKGARYTWADKGPPGSTNILDNLWRSGGLSEAEKKEKRTITDAVDAYGTINDWVIANPNKPLPDIYNLLIKTELQREGIQEKPTGEQRRKARDAAMYKITAYMSFFDKQNKFSLQRALTHKNSLDGRIQKQDASYDLLKTISGVGSSSGDRAEAAAGAYGTGEQESGWSNLWGLFDDDEPTSLQDLNLNQGQQASINSLVSQIKEKGPGWKPTAASKKLIIDNFLDQDNFNTLPDERREAIQELLQAALANG